MRQVAARRTPCLSVVQTAGILQYLFPRLATALLPFSLFLPRADSGGAPVALQPDPLM